MEKLIWQREMESAYLRAHHAKSHDISGLYIELEKILKKYMDSGIMKDGDSFRVPISDGVEFHFTKRRRKAPLLQRWGYKVTIILLKAI